MSYPRLEDLVVYAVPMRSRFRGIDVREGMLWAGPAGWTEFSPFWDYDAHESATWYAAATAAAENPYPPPVRERVPVNCTVPAVGPERAAQIVRASGGCRTAKVKVAEPGQSLAEDLDRVAAVRDALGATGRVRIDANGFWSIDEAVDAITAIDRVAGGLEYVEQPCEAVEDLASVRRRVGVPIAADESIRRAEDPMRIVQLEAADIAVLKVQPLGGVAATLLMAQQIGLPVVVSSALETSIGIAAGVALAAALPELPYACGLNTVFMFEYDALVAPLQAVDGAIAVPSSRLVPDNIERITADVQTRARWLNRLREVHA